MTTSRSLISRSAVLSRLSRERQRALIQEQTPVRASLMAFACASSAALPSDQLTGPGRAQTLVQSLCEAILVFGMKSLNFFPSRRRLSAVLCLLPSQTSRPKRISGS